MKIYGVLNDPNDGDIIANQVNVRKASFHRSDGKGALRRTKQKRRLRTSMNKSKRAKLKNEIKNIIKDLLY